MPDRVVARRSTCRLSACTLAPPLRASEYPRAARLQGSAGRRFDVVPGSARRQLDRGPWWGLFSDPPLTALVEQVEVSNQNVAAAVSAYAQAQALVSEQRAALFPSLALNGAATRAGGGSAQARRTSFDLALAASWEPDIWGELRLAVTGAQASAQASAANLAAARLSAQAALATDYFALREADNEIALLTSAVAAYSRSLRITQNQYDVGIAQRTDVLQARRCSRRRRRISLRWSRSVAVRACDRAPGRQGAGRVERRCRGLERECPRSAARRALAVAAAPARHRRRRARGGRGKRADRHSASGVFAASDLGSLGCCERDAADAAPRVEQRLVARLVGGTDGVRRRCDHGARRRRAGGARCGNRELSADRTHRIPGRRRPALDDPLACRQEANRRAASADADRTEQLTLNQYLQGQVPYTTVVTAQVTALNARQTLSELMSSRQAAAIALIQALGGGWRAPGADEIAGSR